mmetsp:Transcript_18333/g.20750  ORF Transcript_18333/g.20750 Transcript_18333/m.20750 type:complete len:83 (+) Transcript_18333:502-750(+)
MLVAANGDAHVSEFEFKSKPKSNSLRFDFCSMFGFLRIVNRTVFVFDIKASGELLDGGVEVEPTLLSNSTSTSFVYGKLFIG